MSDISPDKPGDDTKIIRKHFEKTFEFHNYVVLIYEVCLKKKLIQKNIFATPFKHFILAEIFLRDFFLCA